MQKESLGEYGSGWGWDGTYPYVFDYEKQHTYKDEFGKTHIEYYPMRYANAINTSKPTISGTWVNYGTGGSSKADTNNCKTEKTEGNILNSGDHMGGQVSCEPHSYNAGNYYNFPVASAKSSEPTPNSVCSKGWRLPENNGKTSYSNLLIVYGIDYNATKTVNTYDATLLNLPLSFLRSGGYNGNLYYQGSYGGYRMASQRLSFSSGDLSPTGLTVAINGFSVRCVGR